jgi:hypothetical protein
MNGYAPRKPGMRKILSVVALLAFTSAHAQWIDKQGNRLADTDDRKAIGRFGAEIVFTTDAEVLEERWRTPSETVNIDSVDNVRINEPIYAFVVFSGCKPRVAGTCNVSMSFRVLRPDGKVYADTPSMEVWQDKQAPPGRALALSVQYLRVRIEPHEQLGRYTVEVQVRDENSGKIIALKKRFGAADR